MDSLLKKPPRPYIGVTGLISKSEIQSTLELFASCGITLQTSRIPMIGILVTEETLRVGTHRKKARYPPLKEIPELLKTAKGKCFATIHYHSKNPGFAEEIGDLLCYKEIYENGLCRGLQLNLADPSSREIQKIRKSFPQLAIILQLNPSLLSTNVKWVSFITEHDYRMLEYFLVDHSRGTGRPIDLTFATAVYKILKSRGVHHGIGFAGGFSHINISNHIRYLRRELDTTNFSIDVESGIRTQNKYDLGKAEQYIANAAQAFRN